MKHTTAPWTLNEHEHEPCELIGNGTIKIAEIYCTDFPAGKADSLLIAAAPDLLDTLYIVLPYIETAEEDKGYKPGAVATLSRKIRDVIAKAEGH